MKVEWVLHSVAVVVEGSFYGVLHMNDWVDGDGGAEDEDGVLLWNEMFCILVTLDSQWGCSLEVEGVV